MAVQAQLFPENMGLPLPMRCLQDWMVYSAPVVRSFEVDYSFSLQDPSRLTVPFHLQQNARNLASVSSSSSSTTCDTFTSVAFSRGLNAQLEMQRQELDCILQLQRLGFALREQRKRQLAMLLNCMESKALYFLKRQEEELARATKKTMELEASLRKAEMERKSWQRLAKAKEAMVIDLSNTLEKVNESLGWVSKNTTEDAVSQACGSCDKEQRAGEVKENSNKMACKHCNTRTSCVLLPRCKHLCSCNSCEALLDSCPVCKSVKEASMNVCWV